MFGLQPLLESIGKTQRTLPELVHAAPEVGSESFPSLDKDKMPYYSSPLERPTTEKCGSCSAVSGTINEIQMVWMTKVLEKLGSESSSQNPIPMEIWPDIPSWSKPPVLDQYLLKPFFIWHPENQFGISVTKGKCPYCSKIGCLKFKQYTQARHVQCLTTDAYMVSARYVCSRKNGGCAKTFAIFYEDVVNKSTIVPSSIFLKCPIQIFRQSAWKTDLVQSMFDLVSGRSKINDFIAMVCNSRTSEYMKTACAYRDHIQYYSQLQSSRDRLTSTIPSTTQYPDFPTYFQHCHGKQDYLLSYS